MVELFLKTLKKTAPVPSRHTLEFRNQSMPRSGGHMFFVDVVKGDEVVFTSVAALNKDDLEKNLPERLNSFLKSLCAQFTAKGFIFDTKIQFSMVSPVYKDVKSFMPQDKPLWMISADLSQNQ